MGQALERIEMALAVINMPMQFRCPLAEQRFNSFANDSATKGDQDLRFQTFIVRFIHPFDHTIDAGNECIIIQVRCRFSVNWICGKKLVVSLFFIPSLHTLTDQDRISF